MKAERTAARLQGPDARRGRPGRRGHHGAQRLGVLARLCQQLGGAAHGLDHERPAHLTRQAHLHARLHEGLGDQEEVGRARAREAGHRIEQALGQAHHRPDGREHVLGPGQIVRGGEGPPGYGRHAGADESRRVGHRPHDRRLATERGLEPRSWARRRRWRARGSRRSPRGPGRPLRPRRASPPGRPRRCARPPPPAGRPRGHGARASPGTSRSARRGARPPAPPRPRRPARPNRSAGALRAARLPFCRHRR